MRRAEKDIVKYIRKFVDICNIQTVYTNNDTGWADIKNWRLNWEKMIDSKKSCMNNGRFEIDFTEVSKETSYCWK